MALAIDWDAKPQLKETIQNSSCTELVRRVSELGRGEVRRSTRGAGREGRGLDT